MQAPVGEASRSDSTSNGIANPQQRTDSEPDPIKSLRNACEAVAKTEPGDVQRIASLHASMILDYYRDVRRQAQQSFIAALVAALVGTLFFLFAVWPMTHSESPLSNISLIAGGLTQVISAINFYLYSRASRQFAMFHVCLERTNRFLLANSLCEHLTCTDRRDEARLELIDLIANAPMLTVDLNIPAKKPRAAPAHKSQAKGPKNDPSPGKGGDQREQA